MTDPLHTLNSLGWEWRENGVVICVSYDRGKSVQVFVPLQKVWDIFNRHMTGVGCPLMLGVGAPFTVGGFFSSIAHAVSHAASSVAKATGVTAITKAAESVAKVAKNYGAAALNTIAKVPIVGPLAKSAVSLVTAPVGMVDALARGGRIDKVALNSLKGALADVKQIAPYAQTVMSLVPGVGTGLSGALGASLALASGQSLNDAFVAGLKGAIPGGALVQAAAGVAMDAMQGKPIADSVLNNLPISDQAKQALKSGLTAAQQMAKGKNVSQALLDNAVHALPPAYQKAIQVGTAVGHAKSLQDAAHSALGAASELASHYKAGAAAQQLLKTLPPSLHPPAAITAAIAKATAARNTVNTALRAAQQGYPMANQIVQALRLPLPPMPHIGAPTRFVPFYIGAPLAHHHAHNRRGRGNVQVKPFSFQQPHSVFNRGHHRAA